MVSSAPLLTVVNAPVFTVPNARALASVIEVVPPVTFTAPTKSLPALVSVMVWPGAFNVVVPLTVTAPV